MACKCSGSSIGPLFLRIAVGIIFLWAGLAKVIGTSEVSGADAAALKEMGVTPKTATVQGAATAASGKTPATAPIPATDKLEVSNAYRLALMLKGMDKPVGDKQVQLWPVALTKERWPVWAAYACTAIELVGGALILVGGLTRLSAFGIASVMMVAMWLTVIGPAIASGHTHLGFLPADAPARATLLMGDFSMFQLQFLCLMMSLALVFLGSGALGIDNVLFGKGSSSKKPRPAPAAEE
jgi:uncharacterized membrane protein YphA (DoxX/SURF4 family)